MKFRDLQSNIKIRLYTDFITDLSQMAIFPFMAIYFSSQVGQGIAGLLLTLNVICSILAGLYAGYLSDRLGRKKVMIFALIIQIGALTIMALANSPWFLSVWVTYFMFLISNVSSSVINPAASAMIIDSSTEKERPYIYSLQYWSGNIAISIGAVLGGLFFESGRFILFCMFALVSIVTLLIIIFLIDESMKEIHAHEENNKPSFSKSIFTNYLNVIKDSKFMFFVMGTVFVLSLEFQLDKYIAVRLKEEFHASLFGFEITGIKMFSLIILINTVFVVVATLHLSKWLSKFSHKLILTIGLVIYSLSFSALAVSNSFFILVGAAVLFTLGELMYSPIKQTILAGMIPDHARASYMAVDSLSFNAAMLLGSLGLTIGAVLPSSGMAVLYLILGFVGLFCFRSGMKHKKTTEYQPVANESHL
ncbi:MFS transporter [Bacillus sp. 31A1R]|uniref:MFS transporter n=1 Tax=Robertmurraya mangrovi TaxID=3098077 RepID=A0ABU5J2E4_9BACI|nr:MFS transporter [Bacillus sp. 31A1R]MDZ5473593.1 MFS transporter [Bacillus sp. 31A1R]